MIKTKAILCAGALGSALLLTPMASVNAAPYATDITNSAGVVSFRLNESADSVKIISGGGAVTNDIGAGVKGLTVTNLGVAAGVIKVEVMRSVAVGYTQTSVDAFQDTNGAYVNKFEQARGMTVNRYPDSASFGRIYIVNTRQANTASPVRTTYDGVYLINSDDSVALDTGFIPRTAGLPITYGNTASPYRILVGKDDHLLYISDFSDPSGGLWVTDLDVATNSVATNVFTGIGDIGFGSTNHGSIFAMAVEGSQASGNLKIFTADEDLTPGLSIWKYDIGSGAFPYGGQPAGPISGFSIANFASKLVRGGSSNYFYYSQNRSAGTDGPSIRIFTEDGVEITNSLAASRAYLANPTAADIFRNTTAIDISPDGKTLALLRGSAFGSVLLVPLTNGVFNFAATSSFSLGTGGASDNNRDIAYDAAGNLYMINTASEFFRIFSRGGATIATTGTDGTFVIGTPPTLLTASASVPTANEAGPVNGQFTITRVGDTAVPLTVGYTIGGTATAGSDYATPSGTVTLLAGASSTNIAVTVIDDSEAELTETIVLTISASASYGVSGGTATVSILDNEPPQLSIGLAKEENRLLEGFSHSKVGLTVTRRGLLTTALTANLAYSGTAVLGTRFSAPATHPVASGAAMTNFFLTPINDEVYQGNQTAIVSIASGSGYSIGSESSTNVLVIDDDYPSGIVLFSDNLDGDSSTNWIVNTTTADSAAEFGFDYSAFFIPPAPGGATTKGLRLRLNELTNAPRNGISASPAGLNLMGDYRLKFQMWINYNGPLVDGGSGSTLHVTSGVGTTPDHPNLGTSGSSDGIWFAVDGDGGSTTATGDAIAYVATDPQPDASGYYAAPADDGPRSTTSDYYSIWGGVAAPAGQLAAYPGQTGTTQPGNMGMSWHTVVLTKATNAVTWVIDGILIATVPADATFLAGNVFVGFQDLFPGAAGVPEVNFAVVDNLRVETYVSAPIIITSVKIVGANAEITFSGPAELAPSAFKLQSSITVDGTYADDDTATIESVTAGVFKGTTSVSGAKKFYRISEPQP